MIEYRGFSRAGLWLLVGLIGCHSDKASSSATTPTPEAVATEEAVAVEKPAAAEPAEQKPEGEGEGEGDEGGGEGHEADFTLYNSESLGPLRAGMSDKEIVAALGKPKKKAKPQEEGATGAWVSAWTWRDAAAVMTGDSKTGPSQARSVEIHGASKLATKQGIHIGSTRAEVEKAYPRSADDDKSDPNSYLAGSVYGGLRFVFAKDRVSLIEIGAFAF